MKGSGQSGAARMQFQFGQGKKPGVISLIVIGLTLGLVLVFGIGLLMIAATLFVLLLPWLWWKKRQLVARMQQAHAVYQSQQDLAGAGVIIEGEVVYPQGEKTAAPHTSADRITTQTVVVHNVTIEQDQPK